MVALLGPERRRQDARLLRCLAGLARRSTHGRIALDGDGARRPGPRRVRAARAPAGRRGVPGLPAVPAPDRARERRLRAAGARHRPRRGARRAAARGSNGSVSATTPAHRPARAVRRAGPARRARPGAGHRAAAAAARRAARRARRRAPAARSAATCAATSTRSTGMRILVTHDPVDAYALADRVVILEARPRRPDRHARRGRRPGPAAATSPSSWEPTSSSASATPTASPPPNGGRVVTATAVPGPAFVAHPAPSGRAVPPGPRRQPAQRLAGDRRRHRSPEPIASACASPATVPLVAEITPAALDALGLRPGDERLGEP